MRSRTLARATYYANAMNYMKKMLFITALLAVALLSLEAKPIKLLVMTKTTGYRHQSIAAAKQALQLMAKQNHWQIVFTEDSTQFNSYKNLKHYNAIIFAGTTGSLFDSIQKASFKKYIQKGGGFVGIHTTTDTEMDWPWYMQMIGAKFKSHPKQQQASFRVVDTTHPSTKMLPSTWSRFDELYNFTDTLNKNIHVLIDLDESTYQGGTMGAHHPIAWYQYFEGGRIFQTALGHTNESYQEELFLQHITGGILWAIQVTK